MPRRNLCATSRGYRSRNVLWVPGPNIPSVGYIASQRRQALVVEPVVEIRM